MGKTVIEMGEKLLEVKNCTCGYKKKTICKDVSIILEEGTITLLRGANGCGKSTLFSVLTNLKKAEHAEFFWKGETVTPKALQPYIGYVPQKSSLIEELTVWDNLMLWYGGKTAVKEALREEGPLYALQIEEMLKLPIRKLSGGMERRVAIGCAMAGNPKILILDEPAAALDLECKKLLREYLKSYAKTGGTVFFSSHEESDYEMADHCLYMHDGILDYE